MFNRFMKWLVPKLEQRCLDRGRLMLISGTDEAKTVYLRRMILFRSKLFSIYIHRFMRSDKDDHHDHPFDFLGYVVTKGYNESILHGRDPHEGDAMQGRWLAGGQFSVARRREGTWGFRPAETRHMVELDRPYSNDEYKDAPLTIIFRGPYRRDWGFWKRFTLDGCTDYYWVLWNEYLGVPPSDVRE